MLSHLKLGSEDYVHEYWEDTFYVLDMAFARTRLPILALMTAFTASGHIETTGLVVGTVRTSVYQHDM